MGLEAELSDAGDQWTFEGKASSYKRLTEIWGKL